MSINHGAQRASLRVSARAGRRTVIGAALLATFITTAILPLEPVQAASTLKVAVIVGPAGTATTANRHLADQAATEARRYTSNVVLAYSPNATWTRVKAAMTGASVVIYIGRGLVSQATHPTTLSRRTQDGFGLNPTAGHGNSTTRYYGETAIRTLRLAPAAVVLAYHLPVASGHSPAGSARATLAVARRRADNFAAGFLAIGASAVIAEAVGTPIYYLGAIFTRSVTLDAMWRAAPTKHGHVRVFTSTRIRGAIGRTDPVHPSTKYYRSIVGRLGMSTSTVRVPPPAPPPATRPPTPVTGAYGSAQGDSRNDHEIGGKVRARLAYRFRASTTSQVTSIRVQQRGGPVYSGGNGGTIRVSIQSDSNGKPSGTILSSMTFSPGNPSGNWEVWNPLAFSARATLTSGHLYHVVFDNVSANPTANWIAINDLLYWGGPFTPRQPTVSDDLAVLYASPTTWVLQGNDTPILDVAYANGAHDGLNYIGSLGDSYGSISGASNKVREHFTVAGSSRTISAVSVKVKRISGSGALTIRLQKGDGTLIASGSVAASNIALGSLPSGSASSLAGNTWATVSFGSSHVLSSGSTYDLVLSTVAGTQYIAVPVQEGTTKGMRSKAFTDGDGQKTTNGSSWANLYPFPEIARTDLQFAFR